MSFDRFEVRIADLGDRTLGFASGYTLWLDDDAAGWGWFVDPTPSDDSEFTTPGDQGEQGRIDLLTVLMHEVGHILGLDHDDEGLMAEALSPGSRVGRVDAATPTPREPLTLPGPGPTHSDPPSRARRARAAALPPVAVPPAFLDLLFAEQFAAAPDPLPRRRKR